jgi:hypothetical protein
MKKQTASQNGRLFSNMGEEILPTSQGIQNGSLLCTERRVMEFFDHNGEEASKGAFSGVAPQSTA